MTSKVISRIVRTVVAQCCSTNMDLKLGDANLAVSVEALFVEIAAVILRLRE